jgi:P-type Cu+ transporter
VTASTPSTLDELRPADAHEDEISLAIGGMSCGACAARVERTLNALPGVRAQVNYASERASVVRAPGVPLSRLIEEISGVGFTAELVGSERDSSADEIERRVRSLRRRLLVAATLFMPLCDTSILFSVYPSLRFAGWQWLMVALAAPVVTWAAWPFYDAAARAARHRTTTMDTLVSIGILSSTGWSLYSMFVLDTGAHTALSGLAQRSGGGIYLDVPAGVTTFLLAGRYFEAWSKRRSGSALRALAAVAAREVSVLGADGGEMRRPIADLRVGERFVVRPGETVAADGEVLFGGSAIDRSVMTGESLPVEVGPGDAVLGGTVSLSGRVVVQTQSVGVDTQLGHMLALVEHAQNEKAAVQRLADRVSSVFVPSVLVLSAGTLMVWLVGGNPPAAAFSAALSVLIIACPCALGLATPAALLVATWAGARMGIFFKGYGALEASREIDTVVLDKTGTLTEGRMTLADCEAVAGVEQRELLRLAGSVEQASEHPLARAIAAVAEHWYGELPQAESFRAFAGAGARGLVEGQRVYVGRLGVAGAPGSATDPPRLPAGLVTRQLEWEASGRTVVIVCRGDSVIGALALADTIRVSAAPAVAQLHALGLRCVLVSGDNEASARVVGAAVGIEDVRAGALPAAKVQILRELQRQGHRVAMIGDGINDAPALAAADLGLAIGSGTDVAINAAELIVMRDDLGVAASAIHLARRTLRTIRGNLAWAFLYNVVALPLAALGLLNPLIAGGAMALSSSFVVWNSSRLRRIAPQTG